MESGSDGHEDDDRPGVSSPKKKRLSRGDMVEKQKHRLQKYRPDWEKDPTFSKWLTQDPKNNYKARCKVCDISMVAEKHIITKHSEGQKHIKYLSVIRGTQNVSSFFTASTSSTLEPSTTKLARIAEIKLAAFFAEHNIAFNVSDHLGKVLKECIPDSKVIKEMNFTRKKNAKIVYKAISPSYKAKLAKELETSKFSVMTDESTDISTNKASCVVVRYFDEDVGKIKSKFWNLHNLFSGDEPNEANEGATANNIYCKLIESFTRHNIPLKNIVGFGSDGCNVMMGSENSVASRFKEECPGIIIMKCTCHSIHLCASAACQKLPNRCEELARSVFRFLKMSSKRCAQLVQFQTFLELKPQKMLHPSQTRWLSLVQVVKRILDHWEALKLYFTDMALSERLVSGQIILDLLRDPYMKLYYEFMSWALPKFTNLNLYFQSEEVVVTELDLKIKELYKDFLFCFMQRNYVNRTEICDINPTDTAWQLQDEQMYLGIVVASKIDTPEIKADMARRKEFFSRCKDFLVESAQQIRKRYDFNSKPLLLLSVLSPVKALSQHEREITPSIFPIVSAFPRVTDITNMDNIQLLDNQWRALASAILPKEITSEKKVDVFWSKLYQWHDLTNDRPFKEISKFVLDCLVLPHANADCERIFSKVNLTKTKIRNKLATQSIDAILLSCDAIKSGSKSGNCTDFIPTEDMLMRLNAKDEDRTNSNIQELINLEGDPSLVEICSSWPESDNPKLRSAVLRDMQLYPNFITEREENALLMELEPVLRRMRYEFDHWDNAIQGFRETERSDWTAQNSVVLNRVRALAFSAGARPAALPHVHVLDLAAAGHIKPHVDAVRFCGDVIAGLCLVSSAVMQLAHVTHAHMRVRALLARRALYIMKGVARYDFTHAVLGGGESQWRDETLPRQRRVALICRSRPHARDAPPDDVTD